MENAVFHVSLLDSPPEAKLLPGLLGISEPGPLPALCNVLVLIAGGGDRSASR